MECGHLIIKIDEPCNKSSTSYVYTKTKPGAYSWNFITGIMGLLLAALPPQPFTLCVTPTSDGLTRLSWTDLGLSHYWRHTFCRCPLSRSGDMLPSGRSLAIPYWPLSCGSSSAIRRSILKQLPGSGILPRWRRCSCWSSWGSTCSNTYQLVEKSNYNPKIKRAHPEKKVSRVSSFCLKNRYFEEPNPTTGSSRFLRCTSCHPTGE